LIPCTLKTVTERLWFRLTAVSEQIEDGRTHHGLIALGAIDKHAAAAFVSKGKKSVVVKYAVDGGGVRGGDGVGGGGGGGAVTIRQRPSLRAPITAGALLLPGIMMANHD
jgi:hypothetical protein